VERNSWKGEVGWQRRWEVEAEARAGGHGGRVGGQGVCLRRS
jgi:hypothetical protein